MQTHILSLVLASGSLALTATALPAANGQPQERDVNLGLNKPSAHSHFSKYCGNVIPYGASTSTITAWCSPHGYNLASPANMYQSHLDLSRCLTNIDGKVSARANGGAMGSCTLGKQGIQACAGCADTIAAITCRNRHGGETANKVDLDDYIGIEWQDVPGHPSVPIISCRLPSDKTNNLGVYDGCTKSGAPC